MISLAYLALYVFPWPWPVCNLISLFLSHLKSIFISSPSCHSSRHLPLWYRPWLSIMSSFLPSLSNNRAKKIARKTSASAPSNNQVNRGAQRDPINRIFDQYRGTSLFHHMTHYISRPKRCRYNGYERDTGVFRSLRIRSRGPGGSSVGILFTLSVPGDFLTTRVCRGVEKLGVRLSS